MKIEKTLYIPMSQFGIPLVVEVSEEDAVEKLFLFHKHSGWAGFGLYRRMALVKWLRQHVNQLYEFYLNNPGLMTQSDEEFGKFKNTCLILALNQFLINGEVNVYQDQQCQTLCDLAQLLVVEAL